MENIKIEYKTKNNIPVLKKNKELPYLEFPGMSSLRGVKHMFTTRLGGVSKGDQESLNLSYRMDSSKEDVLENFSIVANALGCKADDIIGADQTHTANVKIVDSTYSGNAVTKEKAFFDVDGLITNDPNVVLFVTCADCVPILLADPVNKVVAALHSGWKGTCAGIAANAVNIMKESFGSDPKNIHAVIGPSICQGCYEVSEDLYEAFNASKAYEEIDKYSENNRGIDDFYKPGKEKGKYQLSLWEANRLLLLKNGLHNANIEVTDICTCCNPKVLFSHRASAGRRGGLGAFIKIIE